LAKILECQNFGSSAPIVDYKQRNFPAANIVVSMYDKFHPYATNCEELKPTEFAISTTPISL
jgi:hypothetical protein